MYMRPVVAKEIFIYITRGKEKKNSEEHVTSHADKICVTEAEATAYAID